MNSTKAVGLAVGTIFGFGLTIGIGAQADATKVAFPSNYAEGIRWLIDDKEKEKQVREVYAPPEAIEAARKDEAMPDGTVLTLVRYSVKLDAQGSPLKDENHRLIKNAILGINVMQKGKGWGAEYPDTLRNGEWEYRAFKADNTPNDEAKLTACFECHKAQANQDFVYAYEKLKKAAK
jgi:cytochrome c553